MNNTQPAKPSVLATRSPVSMTFQPAQPIPAQPIPAQPIGGPPQQLQPDPGAPVGMAPPQRMMPMNGPPVRQPPPAMAQQLARGLMGPRR